MALDPSTLKNVVDGAKSAGQAIIANKDKIQQGVKIAGDLAGSIKPAEQANPVMQQIDTNAMVRDTAVAYTPAPSAPITPAAPVQVVQPVQVQQAAPAVSNWAQSAQVVQQSTPAPAPELSGAQKSQQMMDKFGGLIDTGIGFIPGAQGWGPAVSKVVRAGIIVPAFKEFPFLLTILIIQFVCLCCVSIFMSMWLQVGIVVLGIVALIVARVTCAKGHKLFKPARIIAWVCTFGTGIINTISFIIKLVN